ncbi:MAG: LacI family DNA-binding transcriptional regulator [Pseudomonadota bacterium]
MRPTVYDIAKDAGVSLATVDRVLNNRPGVREKTIQQVQDAIAKLGYVRDVAAANLARQRSYDFICVLPDSKSEFLAEVRAAIDEAAAGLSPDRTSISVREFPLDNTNKLIELLGEIQAEVPDGVAIMAPETPAVRDAVKRIMAAGTHVTPIISDLPSTDRSHFVGINNVGAGRTAAQLMGRFLDSKAATILVVAGSMVSTDHAERRTGFDETMCIAFPQHNVLPTLEAFDKAENVRERVGEALRHHPDISGIYSIGAGNQGLVSILHETGRAKDIIVVAHELTDCSRNALMSGTFDAVIAQNVGHIVRSAVRTLKAQTDNLQTIESQERIRTEIFIAENLS